MTDSHNQLSPAGLRKREQILATALVEARRCSRRRFAVRSTVALAALAGISVMLMHRPVERNLIVRMTPVSPRGVSAPVSTQPSVSAPILHGRAPEIVITHLQTDLRLVSRLAVAPQASPIAHLSDGELLDQLATIHQPAALARVKGRTVLLYGNVSKATHHLN